MEDLSDPGKRQQMEYDTQFFQFPPESLIDTMIGDATDIVADNVKAASLKIKEQFKGKVDGSEIDEAMKAVGERYKASTENIYYRFGNYVKENVLHIPKYVLLPEDEIHRKEANCNANDLRLAKSNFESLCTQIKSAKAEKTLLEAKLKNLKLVKERQEPLLKRTNSLKEAMAITKAINRNAEALEKKLEVLRPLMEKIENNQQQTEVDQSKKRPLELNDKMLNKKMKIPEL